MKSCVQLLQCFSDGISIDSVIEQTNSLWSSKWSADQDVNWIQKYLHKYTLCRGSPLICMVVLWWVPSFMPRAYFYYFC